MAKDWKNLDTFAVWRDKYNELINESLIGSFDQDHDNTTNSDFVVEGGKLRLGSDVVDVNGATFSIPVSDVNIIALYTDPSINELRIYQDGSVPTQFVIPLFKVTSDVDGISLVEDLRTWVDLSGSANDTDSGILTFNQSIAFDKDIPAGRNALSIDPVIESGVTVTVADGSTWVIL